MVERDANSGPQTPPACEVKLRSASAFPSATWERGSEYLLTANGHEGTRIRSSHSRLFVFIRGSIDFPSQETQ